ncbi:hypothetical protein BGZ50_001887, partial [Haplosporangium sp. Z 11]
QQQQQQQQKQHDLSTSPSSMSSAGFSPSPFQTPSLNSSVNVMSEDRQRAQSADTIAAVQDTPSPESYQVADMTGSFPAYLGPDNTVPMGIRQALGDADKIFRFQEQECLTRADDSMLFDAHH